MSKIDDKIFKKLYNNGYSETEIAEYFSISRGYVHNYKDKIKDELNSGKHNRELIKRRKEYKDDRFNEFKYNYYSKIKKEYLSGSSLEEIQSHIHKRAENIQEIINSIKTNNKNYELHRKNLKEKLAASKKKESITSKAEITEITTEKTKHSIENWKINTAQYYGVLTLDIEIETYSNDGHYTDFLTYGIRNNSELIKYAYDVRLNKNNGHILEYYFFDKKTNTYANPYTVIEKYANNPDIILNLLGLD